MRVILGGFCLLVAALNLVAFVIAWIWAFRLLLGV